MRFSLIAVLILAASAASVSAQPFSADVTRRLERFADVAARLDREFCEPGDRRLLEGAVDGINAMPDRGDAPPVHMRRPTFAAFAETYESLLEASDNDDAIEGAALAGMIAAVDPGGAFYTDRNAFDRTGNIYLTFAGGTGPLVVTEVLPDGPAAQAGVQAGDLLVAIDGKPLQNLRREDASRQLAGEVNSALLLTIERDGATATLSIQRARIGQDVPTVQWRRVDGAAVITITQFKEDTGQLLRDALADMQRGGAPSGYILDLRDNQGGLLDQVIDAADQFILNGPIVTTRPIAQCHATDIQRYHGGRGPGDTGDARIVVLVNGGTASGAEAVAAALRDRLNATLIGQHTLGNASVHTLIPLNGGRDGFLRITVANMHSPSEATWQGVGLVPDIVTEPRTTGADPALVRALTELGSATQ